MSNTNRPVRKGQVNFESSSAKRIYNSSSVIKLIYLIICILLVFAGMFALQVGVIALLIGLAIGYVPVMISCSFIEGFAVIVENHYRQIYGIYEDKEDE